MRHCRRKAEKDGCWKEEGTARREGSEEGTNGHDGPELGGEKREKGKRVVSLELDRRISF